MIALQQAMRSLLGVDRRTVECQWRKDLARGDALAGDYLAACDIDVGAPCAHCRLTQRHHSKKGQRKARLARKRAVQFGPQAELCRSLRCCACGAAPPSDPEHVRTRGAGGRDADTVPLCRECHVLRHALGQLQLCLRRGLPMAEAYRAWWAEPGAPTGYFEHVAAGLAAVLSLSMGLAIARGEEIDRAIARGVYGSFAR